MRITESRLRSIIRSVISESFDDNKKIDRLSREERHLLDRDLGGVESQIEDIKSKDEDKRRELKRLEKMFGTDRLIDILRNAAFEEGIDLDSGEEFSEEFDD